MLIDRANLTATVCLKGPSRHTLNVVAFGPRGTTTTNGHVMLVVPYPDVDPEEFPAVEGVDAAQEPPEKTVLVPSKACATVGKRLPGPSTTRPILRNALVAFDDKQVTFGITDLELTDTTRVRLNEGTFPDAESVIPKQTKLVAVLGIGELTYLLKAMETAIKARGGSTDTVLLEISDDPGAKPGTSPIVLRHKSIEVGELLGVIMPVTLRNG